MKTLGLAAVLLAAPAALGQAGPLFDSFARPWSQTDPVWSTRGFVWKVFSNPDRYCTVIPGNVTTNVPSLLVLTCNQSGGTAYGAQVESRNANFGYGSYRARMKISPPPANLDEGVCNAFFTWSSLGEIDLEFRSRWQGSLYRGVMDIVVHNTGVSPAQRLHLPCLLPFDPSASFHDYGFDWRPNRIDFFVDSRLVATVTSAQNPIPVPPAGLFINNWTNNPTWGGDPPTLASPFQLDWVSHSRCFFTTDRTELSLAQGGTPAGRATLSLDAGPANGGMVYAILPSLGTTDLGLPMGAFTMPLDLDVSVLFLLPLFPGFLGLLDGAGQAVNTTLLLPPGLDPGLIGLRLTLAYLTIDLARAQFPAASNPLAIRLVR